MLLVALFRLASLCCSSEDFEQSHGKLGPIFPFERILRDFDSADVFLQQPALDCLDIFSSSFDCSKLLRCQAMSVNVRRDCAYELADAVAWANRANNATSRVMEIDIRARIDKQLRKRLNL